MVMKKEINELLLNGKSKQQIWRKLRTDENQVNLAFHLNNLASSVDRKKHFFINIFLAGILLFLTFKKVYAAASYGHSDLFFFLSLVVPIINMFVLREVLRFHRVGYQFLFILSCLSLFRPENRQTQELLMFAVIIGLSGFLHLKLFPFKNYIKIPKHAETK